VLWFALCLLVLLSDTLLFVSDILLVSDVLLTSDLCGAGVDFLGTSFAPTFGLAF